MNVLSLFDGISCGQQALKNCGIFVDSYFASEIDKHAKTVTQKNFPTTVQLGDVTSVQFKDGYIYSENGSWFVGTIDLILGGSPCQGFSLAGKQLALDDPRSKLYFEYERILSEVRTHNPNVKFILENVKMKPEYRDVISTRLGVNPIAINSSLVSAQNRYRLYWTNIQIRQLPIDKGIILSDILEKDVSEKYFIRGGRLLWLKRFGEIKEENGYVKFNPTGAKCLTARGDPSWNCAYILQWPHGANPGGIKGLNGKTPCMTSSAWESNNLLLNEGFVRKLTPLECERLQTLPDNYTSGISDTQRYKALGNGWTVAVIVHILQGLQ